MFQTIFLTKFTPGQWLEYYRLSYQITQESYPYREVMDEERFLRDPRPLFVMSSGIHGFVLYRGDRMIACCHYRCDSEHSICTSEIKFLAGEFESDAARHMTDSLLNVCTEQRLSILQMVVENERILRHYLDSGDFQKVGQVRESVLELARMDRPLLEAWQTINPGFMLRSISWTDSNAMHALVAVYNESMADVPYQNAVGMVRSRDGDFFLGWADRMKQQDLVLLAYGLYEKEQLAGIALFEARVATPKVAMIQYTGIARAFRQRGLGKHLKAASTLQMMTEFPSLRFIVTSNEESNTAMLAINQAMGFDFRSEFTMLRYMHAIK